MTTFRFSKKWVTFTFAIRFILLLKLFYLFKDILDWGAQLPICWVGRLLSHFYQRALLLWHVWYQLTVKVLYLDLCFSTSMHDFVLCWMNVNIIDSDCPIGAQNQTYATVLSWKMVRAVTYVPKKAAAVTALPSKIVLITNVSIWKTNYSHKIHTSAWSQLRAFLKLNGKNFILNFLMCKMGIEKSL